MKTSPDLDYLTWLKDFIVVTEKLGFKLVISLGTDSDLSMGTGNWREQLESAAYARLSCSSLNICLCNTGRSLKTLSVKLTITNNQL